MKSLGNDPFDYEKKFPEDKQYEELGPAARVWRTCLEECAASDSEMVEGWRDGLDVLLIFAGLFSAVVTTFVAQTSQSLKVDYSEVTALLLIELIKVQRSASNGSPVNNIPRSDITFRPSTSDSWVNGLWFTSLSLSLTAALFAVLTKQWIHQYMSASSGTPRDRCHVRQFRYMGLQQWGVGLIIGLLPVLMSASLAVFLLGLVIFIIPLRVSIASVVGAITFISFSSLSSATSFGPYIHHALTRLHCHNTCSISTPIYDTPLYAMPIYPAPICATPINAAPIYAASVYATPIYPATIYSASVYASPVYVTSALHSTPSYSSYSTSSLHCPSSTTSALHSTPATTSLYGSEFLYFPLLVP
ncbi:hypothetical protein IW262DRAFT_1262713 [Armillaria fumosa]|nr:hypothetical protein IW262DRAFT_1262713 [Armillaria fumosa]